MSAKILLVDDHSRFRTAVRGLLEKKGFRVVGEAGNGREALEQARELAPDVVVTGISMPDLDGIEATRGILLEAPDTKVIALSIHGGKYFVERMLQAGAAGYILKESVPEQLVECVRAVQRGEQFLSPAVTGLMIAQYVDLLSRVHATGGPAKLIEKERRFIQLLGEGCTEEEITEALGATESAVKSLQQRVLKKLDLSAVEELIEYAGAQKWFVDQEEIEAALQHAATSTRKTSRPPKPQPLIEPLRPSPLREHITL